MQPHETQETRLALALDFVTDGMSALIEALETSNQEVKAKRMKRAKLMLLRARCAREGLPVSFGMPKGARS